MQNCFQVSQRTTIAIWKYEDILMKEYQLEKARIELSESIKQIPKEDMPYYFNRTQLIESVWENQKKPVGVL